jgi:undecaprenyl-diphosphatase
LTAIQGLILGVVQGLGEFLPISSSAHLVLAPWLFGWTPHTLTFDVALHMGTLAALFIYFWRDIWQLIAAWLPPGAPEDPERDAPHPESAAEPAWRRLVSLLRGQWTATDEADAERALRQQIGLNLLIGTVPAAIVGALFAERIESSLRAPVLVALLMIVAAVLLASADRAGIQDRGIEAIGAWQALAIGVAQALALAPGVSRSGVTLAAALFLGLTREAAARYVFLLSVPVTAGAGIFQLRHLAAGGIPADERLAFLVGVTTSLVVGLLAIGGLLRYLRHRNLDVFVAYRIVVGVLVLLVAVLGLR